MSRGYCECGCGEKTRLASGTDRRKDLVKGEPIRFVMGHHLRKSPVAYLEQDRGHETPCWVWQRATTGPDGYGSLWDRAQGRVRPAHAVYYERTYGPVPHGLQLDHLCRIRACVNPSHLEPVTGAENTRRGKSAKLNQRQVAEMRALIADGWVLADIGRAYGVTRALVRQLRDGRVWAEHYPNL